MPRLPKPKEEAFAQAVAGRAKLIDAYEMAGYVRRRGNPDRPARRPRVAARIAELVSQVTSTDLLNIEYISAKLIEVVGTLQRVCGNRDIASLSANDLRALTGGLDQIRG